jgi:hypothetical protein
VHNTKAYAEVKGIANAFFFGNIQMWAVSVSTLLRYPQRKSTGHTFTRRQGGHKSQSRHYVKEKSFAPSGN